MRCVSSKRTMYVQRNHYVGCMVCAFTPVFAFPPGASALLYFGVACVCYNVVVIILHLVVCIWCFISRVGVDSGSCSKVQSLGLYMLYVGCTR